METPSLPPPKTPARERTAKCPCYVCKACSNRVKYETAAADMDVDVGSSPLLSFMFIQ